MIRVDIYDCYVLTTSKGPKKKEVITLIKKEPMVSVTKEPHICTENGGCKAAECDK